MSTSIIKVLKISLVYALREDGEEMALKPALAITNENTVRQAGIKYYTCNKVAQ